MITSAQQNYIDDHAYVPEHLPRYVTAISQTEPFLFGDYLVYGGKGHLTLIGYPLTEPFREKQLLKALENAVNRLKPETISLSSPSLPLSLKGYSQSPSDHYYRLDLSSLTISQKLRNMLRRAARELSIGKNKLFDEQHKKLVEDFLKINRVDEATRSIFQKIDKYLVSSDTAWIFDARNRGNELVAFDVAEFRPKGYSFYMFNFTSSDRYVPGASDLLLSEVIQQTKKESRKFINLGLGIDAGVTFFKKKWGGAAFLSHAYCFYRQSKKESLEALLQKL